jgi:hypothetical protein
MHLFIINIIAIYLSLQFNNINLRSILTALVFPQLYIYYLLFINKIYIVIPILLFLEIIIYKYFNLIDNNLENLYLI